MNTVIGVVSALVTLIAAALGIFKYFDVRSKREQREAVGTAFRGVVTTLAGSDRVERLGSGILLRRFFSKASEYSKPDMPYANEAIDVIAARLTSGVWRENTSDEQALSDQLLQTPWNDIETGIAVGLGILVLTVRAGCSEHGVFGLPPQNVGFERSEPADAATPVQVAQSVLTWARATLR